MTQASLATATGVSQETISRIETGQRPPALETALAIARVLGCPAEILFSTKTTDQERAAA